MIELLVVVAILGILAVVVLGAINPLEQINRGRDTRSRTDAENIITAIERYSANIGWFPWMDDDSDPAAIPVDLTQVTNALFFNSDCGVLDELGQGDGSSGCEGTQELKAAMVDRVDSLSVPRGLYLYYRGSETGDSIYVCFSPQSNAYRQQAATRCGAGDEDVPADLAPIYTDICVDNYTANISGEDGPMVCLP